MSEFPKWKYHATHKPILIQNAEQEEKLGDAWKNSPAEHGVVTAPSVEQLNVAERGFDPFAEEAALVENQDGEINVGPKKRR